VNNARKGQRLFVLFGVQLNKTNPAAGGICYDELIV
jgi:hypothetical protein